MIQIAVPLTWKEMLGEWYEIDHKRKESKKNENKSTIFRRST